MFYFNYFIKCFIRRFVYIITKPKFIIPFLILILLYFFLMYCPSVQAYTSDTSVDFTRYTTLYDGYDSIANTLVSRLKNPTIQNQLRYSDLLNDMKNNFYYLTWSGDDGQDLSFGSSVVNPTYIVIYTYPQYTTTVYNGSINNYMGIPSNFRNVSSSSNFYKYEVSLIDNNIYRLDGSDFIASSVLLSYKPLVLNDFLFDNSTSQNAGIVGAIEQQTESINEQTNSIQQQTQVQQETQNFLKDDTVSDDSMSVDSSAFTSDQQQSNQADVDNFFTNFLNTVKDTFVGINTTVETIEIPLPNGLDSITLSSDIISKHIHGTIIYTLIQTFWYFLIGGYIVIYVKRLLDWLSTGKIVASEKGVFGLIEWLDVHNEIIKSYMM